MFFRCKYCNYETERKGDYKKHLSTFKHHKIKKKAVEKYQKRLKKDEIELISINSIDFKDAYKVKITEGEKVSYRYYSIDSGLLLSEEQQDDSNNITSENYGDYRDVNGIKFPFNINTPSQKIELNITEILINEELKDSDF